MRYHPTNRKRNSLKRNVFAFGAFLIFFYGCLSAQTLIVKGENAPFELSVLGTDNQFVANVDSFIVLSKTRIAIRKKDDIGFQLYNYKLNLLGNAKVSAAKRQMNDIIPFAIGKEWGIADSNGVLIIKPKFEEVLWVNADKIGVKIDNKFAIVGKNGKWIMKPGMPLDQFEKYTETSNCGKLKSLENQFDRIFLEDTGNIKRIQKDGFYGYINCKTERVIASPKFMKAEPFLQDKAVVKISKGYNLINGEGAICELQYFDSIVSSPNKNLVFYAGKGDDSWMGLLSDNCEIVVPGTYKFIDHFSGEYAVCSKNGNGKNYLSNEGDDVFPKMSFEKAEPVVGGFGVVRFNNAFHVLDVKSANPRSLFLSENRKSFRLVALE
jgi:hypothetical protein